MSLKLNLRLKPSGVGRSPLVVALPVRSVASAPPECVGLACRSHTVRWLCNETIFPTR
jgi:hypothetical protein